MGANLKDRRKTKVL